MRETALRVIRTAGRPVLALPSDAWGVPHRALVGMDFTASSEHAARAALDLLAGEGTLYIAHVTPRVAIPQGDSRTWDEITTGAVIPKLEAVVRRLDPSPGVRVEHVLLHGEPAHELTAFAEQLRIDMIAAGAHGRSALGRLMLGSVSTKLVRTAKSWVLVAPPRFDTTAGGHAPPNDWV
jgi:nucleotide-binding universal stress UspA family protein